jgi:hypothetical protein
MVQFRLSFSPFCISLKVQSVKERVGSEPRGRGQGTVKLGCWEATREKQKAKKEGSRCDHG